MSARFGFWLILPFLLLLPFQLAAQSVADSAGGFDPFPLRPADTSSPRDTLRSFNAGITEAMHAWRAGSRLASVAVRKPGRRAVATFDFSQLPEREQYAKKLETVLLLKEILDRILLPPDDEIPGDQEVAGKEPALTSWTIPNTAITIAKLEEGPRAGEFLFTAGTVDRLEQFYEAAKHLPYKPGALIGIYDDIAHSPGSILPRIWVTFLPEWARFVVFGEALWQWLGFTMVVVMAFLLVRLLLRWGRRWDQRHRNAKALMRLGAPLSVLAGIVVVYACRYVFFHVLRLISDVWVVISFILWMLIFAGVAWLIVLTTSRIADAINDARQVKEGSIDNQLVRTVLRLVSLVILVLLVLYAAGFFGIPLTPVVASLGVGGLAIALAVRPTLENIIGGLTLFADKPVRIGEFCRFGDEYGTVEQIGLRSTRLRKLDDTLVSVPNADFSQRELINYTQRRQRLYRTTLGLRYETTPEQLRYVMAKLREMLVGHPKVSPDWLHVRFRGFGAYSLDVQVFAYVRAKPWLEFKAIREDINLRVMDIVKEAGTGFAFPSQTAYLGRDEGLDQERGRHAETEVQAWRSKGRLPFPEFEEGFSVEQRDTLDYPPEGSPGYRPRRG